MYRIERIVVKAPYLEYVTSELTVNTVEQDIVLDPLNLDTLVKLYRGFKYDYITCVRGTLLLAQQSNQEAIGLLLDLITNGGQGFQLAGTEINVSDEGVHIGSFSRVNFSGSSVLAEVDYGDPSGDTVKITGLASINVINSLTSDSVVDALSAAQGKALKTLVDTKTSVGVLNVLDSMSEVSALSAKQGKVLKDSIDGITSITVVDNLASNSTTSALSAKQGKALSDAITSAVSTVVVDSLSSNSETSALSAKQGKALKDLVDTKTSVAVLDVLNSDSATSALSAKQGKALDVRLTAAELDIDDLESAIPLKADLISGIVPDVQLPAKNVLQYASTSVFPIVGAIGTIYIAIDTNFIYRWNGSVYIKLSDIDVLTIGASAFTRYDITQSLTYAEKIKLADNVGLYETTVNTQSVLAYETGDTSTDNDGRTYLRMTYGLPNTVKIKTNQTKPITIRQAGAGATTLTSGPGVSLNGSLSFSGIHSTKTVRPISAGVYDIIDHY